MLSGRNVSCALCGQVVRHADKLCAKMTNMLTDHSMPENPFSPGFGESPFSLVGRDHVLNDLWSGLLNGPRDPRFTSMVMGVRGSGKTVMLNEIED